MRNRTKHELSWLTAISDAGSTPAASTITKLLIFQQLVDLDGKTQAKLYSHCTVAPLGLPQFGDSSTISLKSGCSCFPFIPATIQTAKTPATRLGAVVAAPSGYGDRSAACSFARAPRPIAGRRPKNFDGN